MAPPTVLDEPQTRVQRIERLSATVPSRPECKEGQGDFRPPFPFFALRRLVRANGQITRNPSRRIF